MSKEQGFIEATRKVRNTYAHNIQYVDVSLIELIKQRTDKSHLLKNLSAIKNYDEANFIAAYEKDRGLFWFGIIDSTMLFYSLPIILPSNESCSGLSALVNAARCRAVKRRNFVAGAQIAAATPVRQPAGAVGTRGLTAAEMKRCHWVKPDGLRDNIHGVDLG